MAVASRRLEILLVMIMKISDWDREDELEIQNITPSSCARNNLEGVCAVGLAESETVNFPNFKLLIVGYGGTDKKELYMIIVCRVYHSELSNNHQ
ncbi:hypothetical protein L2E82_31319 [Cichorium intybus]|uniref:Uncharacterized protein n=1 Tax=Cichorium intybus TaxID=13427 RepID=A0ACB9D2X5_CICIN|nr:hypothetical protein L2E82_31319 [Cichorium intybus]